MGAVDVAHEVRRRCGEGTKKEDATCVLSQRTCVDFLHGYLFRPKPQHGLLELG